MYKYYKVCRLMYNLDTLNQDFNKKYVNTTKYKILLD